MQDDHFAGCKADRGLFDIRQVRLGPIGNTILKHLCALAGRQVVDLQRPALFGLIDTEHEGIDIRFALRGDIFVGRADCGLIVEMGGECSHPSDAREAL